MVTWGKWIDYYVLCSFYFCPAERTSTRTSISLLDFVEICFCKLLRRQTGKSKSGFYLPRIKARWTQQMSTGFYSNIFCVLRTNFTKLKCRSHFAIQHVLLLSNLKENIEKTMYLQSLLYKHKPVRDPLECLWQPSLDLCQWIDHPDKDN